MKIKIWCRSHNQPVVGDLQFEYVDYMFNIDVENCSDLAGGDMVGVHRWVAYIYDQDDNWLADVNL